jgi:hypothetical protein
MRSIHRRLPAGFALALALTALAAPAIAATGPTATGRSAPPPTFTVPASARVHGTGSTTVPAGSAPKVATTTPAVAAPSTVATAPAGATSPGATTTTPAATAPASTVPASTTPAVATGAPVGTTTAGTPARHTGSTKLSTGAIVAAALAVLLILICLAWGVARWFAYEPRWSISLRHSLAEASWRLSASWDEFSDWARIGR